MSSAEVRVKVWRPVEGWSRWRKGLSEDETGSGMGRSLELESVTDGSGVYPGDPEQWTEPQQGGTQAG